MSWNEVDPIVKTIPNCKASIRVVGTGPKMLLSFSEPFHRGDLGLAKKASIAFGEGDTAGKLLLKPGKGKFDISPYNKGGAKIANIPLPKWVPDGHRESEPCTTEMTAAGWIISMPLDAWHKQVLEASLAKPKPVAQHPIPVLAHLKAAGSAPISGKVNAEKYLRARGWKCTKLSPASFTLDGERVTINEILKQVNHERIKQKLPTLTLDGIE